MPLMKAMVAQAEVADSSRIQAKLWPAAIVFVSLALVWLEVIHHLANEWSLNPQYGYGWSVPFLVLYLIGKRWLHRPAPVPPARRTSALALVVSAALLIGPVRFLAEANPDWRLLSWAFALNAVVISLGVFFLIGGSPWLRHFAFPFLFFLVAVPWPVQLEQVVVQGLMRGVTGFNVFVLNLAGIPALQRGNVIELSSGFIGIEEACSGVRSLQATLMVSLFLGEFYSFPVLRRVFLVVAGAVLAFLCNLVRTGFLVWIGARHGAKAIEAWHDPAGLGILLVCLFVLWLLSLIMCRRNRLESEPRLPAAPSSTGLRRVTPLVVSLSVWMILIESAVQLWYGAHESSLAASRWHVRWPNSDLSFETVPIAPETESLLRYNQGGGAKWTGANGHRWMMYFFRWLPGRTAALFVKIHRPDVCLPASGMTLVNDNGIHLLDVNGVNLPIRSYRFDDHGTPLHVFYCYWDARSSYQSEKAANEEDWTPQGRIRTALRGRRETGAQMLELVIWGYDDDTEATKSLREQLGKIIVPG
jgi:exosortase